ncbi:hypothetical protein BN946_scf184940.g81 [Trametes cinnabarina]|uniref:DUF6534 domain-containing protein n=1 Tax=Pycnoporus cinnabarinus TaxID=5643 RepID=A0A060SI88_PYCCI|nr:hypothetical protein BN946_scf184940.g81 [Trametes cinnabarina]
MPLSLANLEAHPGRYIGPQLVSLALEAVLTGIVINQSLTFWERAERERNVVRALVSFVTIIAFLQSGLRFYTAWRMFVEQFGNWTFRIHFGVVPEAEVEAGPLPKVPISPTLLDVLVTGILLTFLARSKQNVTSSRFRRILRRLTVLIWEAALPPCICAVLTVITYLTLVYLTNHFISTFSRSDTRGVIQVDIDYWDLTFQAILGKLYVLSLFVTLNGRATLQDGPVPGFSTHHLSNLGWSLSAPIRVDIPTDIENGGVSTRNAHGDYSRAADTPTESSRTAGSGQGEKLS